MACRGCCSLLRAGLAPTSARRSVPFLRSLTPSFSCARALSSAPTTPRGAQPAPQRTTVQQALCDASLIGSEITVTGLVHSSRSQKSFSFLQVSDGTCVRHLQVLWPTPAGPAIFGAGAGATAGGAGGSAASPLPPPAGAPSVNAGCSVTVRGTLAASPKPGQPVELVASSITLHGPADPLRYPLQAGRAAPTPEFLRAAAHLRPRTVSGAAVLRVRHTLTTAVHGFFDARGFVGVNTPILTANDCEGAGELFQVVPASELSPGPSAPHPRPASASASASAAEGAAAPAKVGSSFFGQPVYLTVSGQLHLEAFACAMGRVYTLGPTFRAENSNTPRHLAEFWMLEPELAPGTAADAMDLAEDCVRSLAATLLSVRGDDIDFLSTCSSPTASTAGSPAAAAASSSSSAAAAAASSAASLSGVGAGAGAGAGSVRACLESLAGRSLPAGARFPRITYTEAIRVLRAEGARRRATAGAPVPASGRALPTGWKVEPTWGAGLTGEHERWLAESHVGGPLFVTDYPAAIKPFYMRRNDVGGGDSGRAGGAAAAEAAAAAAEAAAAAAEAADVDDDDACRGPTVAAFDFLVPRIGELIGGSAREERYEILAAAMQERGLLSPAVAAAVLGAGVGSAVGSGGGAAAGAAAVGGQCSPPADGANGTLDWYLDTRKYGTLPHAGWGMGFERLVMLATGVDNIRDAIPVPRVPGASGCVL